MSEASFAYFTDTVELVTVEYGTRLELKVTLYHNLIPCSLNGLKINQRKICQFFRIIATPSKILGLIALLGNY